MASQSLSRKIQIFNTGYKTRSPRPHLSSLTNTPQTTPLLHTAHQAKRSSSSQPSHGLFPQFPPPPLSLPGCSLMLTLQAQLRHPFLQEAFCDLKFRFLFFDWLIFTEPVVVFFNWSRPITLLDPGAQYSDLIFLYIKKQSPWQVEVPSVTIQSYQHIIIINHYSIL